jgi:hypothetical protein
MSVTLTTSHLRNGESLAKRSVHGAVVTAFSEGESQVESTHCIHRAQSGEEPAAGAGANRTGAESGPVRRLRSVGRGPILLHNAVVRAVGFEGERQRGLSGRLDGPPSVYDASCPGLLCLGLPAVACRSSSQRTFIRNEVDANSTSPMSCSGLSLHGVLRARGLP